MELEINGNRITLPDVPDETPLLWILRETLGLTGTKYGCGVGTCGACTIHVGETPMRSCQLTVADVEGEPITTIEGLADKHADPLHPVQQAWIEQSVPQCGFCQAGQIMSAAALLQTNPRPSDTDINQAMSGNLCRCGTYDRIRKAIKRAAEKGAA